MKLREFKAYIYEDGRGEIISTQYPDPYPPNDPSGILVREVSHQYDLAVWECIKALEFYRWGKMDEMIVGNLTVYGAKAREALVVLKRARGEE